MEEQKINVCRALAGVFAANGEVSEQEAAYVWRTAADLGLDEGAYGLISGALEVPVDLKSTLATITDPDIRRFFFRRFVAATLIDQELSEKERGLIQQVIDTFGWDSAVAQSYVEHMQAFIDYERKGEEILAKLG